MLRKKLAVLVAAALMSLTASSAFAAFADLELIRINYDRAGNEYATDLGNINTILTNGLTNAGTGTFAGATLVSYFALDRATNQLWVSGVNAATATFTPAIIGGSTGLTSIKSGTTFMYNTYNSVATNGGTSYAGLASNPNSYKAKLSATQGWFGNTITAANSARTFSEISMATLATNNTQSLWYFADGLTTVAANKLGVAVASIVTNADGSTTISSNAPVTTTPIPAAFYLMGSGLMGLVGLRRRNKVA